MATTGSLYSAMLNVNGGKFDLLQVFDPETNSYVNVADLLTSLANLEGQIQDDNTRIQALESKVESLDQEKAPLFVVVEPLHLKTDVFLSSCIPKKCHHRLQLKSGWTATTLTSSFQVVELILLI